MSDLMKAFCGVAETPYGFAGDAGIDAAYAARRAAIAAWEEFVESDSPATQLPRDMWDWDSESQEGISDCDVRRFADRVERGLQSLQQERWSKFLADFRRFANDMEVVRGNVVFEAIAAGQVSATSRCSTRCGLTWWSPTSRAKSSPGNGWRISSTITPSPSRGFFFCLKRRHKARRYAGL